MLKGFREFVARGNVTDLAVAVVIGAAFSTVVDSVVEHVLNPVIGLLFQSGSLDDALTVTVHSASGETAVIQFGVVVGALIQFLIVAAFVYVAVVLPINRLKSASFARHGAEEDELPPTELELLGQIRDLLESASAAERTAPAHRAAAADAQTATDTESDSQA